MPDAPPQPSGPPVAPLLVIPAMAIGVQGMRNVQGTPVVMVQLTNAIATTNFPMDLDQARQHIDNMTRAILEAQAMEVPKRELLTP